MNKTKRKGRSERAFAGTPGVLAFLVCESRARRSDLSHDRLSNQWIPDHLISIIHRLYSIYVKQVYPLDSIVLACRNRFILKQINLSDEDAEIIMAPSGLVSYPYLSGSGRVYTEIDLGEVVEYKSTRAARLLSIESLPSRNVRYLSQDLASISSQRDLKEWFTTESQRIIILEGISYYLSKDEWWSLIDVIFINLRVGDKLIFDMWPKSEKRFSIYNRFLRYCNRLTGFHKKKFHFISMNELKAHFFSTCDEIDVTVKTENVRDICLKLFSSDELQNADILNDTLVIVEKKSIL